MTPRQTLVIQATCQLRRWRANNEWVTDGFGARRRPTAEDAVISVLDGYFEENSEGAQMSAYYQKASPRAYRMLLDEIAERA